MGHCQAALLADRAVFRVTGIDARKFLQGMLTNDVGKLSDGEVMHAGLLAPQGKILFELFVVAAKEDFLVEVTRDRMAELIKRLGFYRLRSKVAMREEPDIKVAAVWPAARGRYCLSRSTPRCARMARAAAGGHERE